MTLISHNFEYLARKRASIMKILRNVDVFSTDAFHTFFTSFMPQIDDFCLYQRNVLATVKL